MARNGLANPHASARDDQAEGNGLKLTADELRDQVLTLFLAVVGFGYVAKETVKVGA